MRIRNALSIVLAIAMVLAPIQSVVAALDYDFDDITRQGWTDTHGIAWLGRHGDAGGPPYSIESANTAGTARSHDGAHNLFVFSSPEFMFDDTDNSDMTFVMFGGNSSGGVSPLDSTYADYAAAHPISQNAGFVGVALRNLTTDTYVWAVASDTGNNATDKTYTVTEAFIDTLDSAAHYKLEFIDWNQGGWGWTDFDTVHIPGKTEFDDGYLNSIATGDWNVGGTWDGTVPGGIPTSLSIVNVSGGDTVTVPLFSLGAAANELNIAALGAVVVDDPLVVAATVDIEATGTMTVTGNGTLTANAITTEAAGAIAIDASGDVIANTASTSSFTFADATSGLDAATLTIDSAIDLDTAGVVIGDDVTIATGGSLSTATGGTTAYTSTGSLTFAGGTLASSGIDVVDLTVGSPVTVATGGTFAVSGQLSIIPNGELIVDDGFEVGGLGTVGTFVLDGGKLDGAAGGTTYTTNSDWNFQGGEIGADAILAGNYNIIVGADRTSDGTLIMNGTNTAAAPAIVVRRGAIRGIPAGHTLQLDSNNDSQGAVVELTATGTVELGTGIGQVNITNRGGFSAAAGVGVNVDVTLADNLGVVIPTLTWANFNNQAPQLGSKTGTGSVTLTNPIDLGGVERTITVVGSDVDPDFFAQFGGGMSNINRLNLRGDGRLKIPALTTTKRINIFGGELIPTGDLNLSTNGTRDESIYVDGADAKLTIPAGVTVSSRFWGLFNNATVDVSGTAISREDWFDTYSGTDVIIRNGGYWQAGTTFDKNIALANDGSTLTVEDGGKASAHYMQVWDKATLTVDGNVWTQNNHDRFDLASGAALIIGPTGSLRAGSDELDTLTPNRNWDIDDTGTTVTINGGEGKGHRLHFRNRSITNIYGTEDVPGSDYNLYSNENIYIQTDNTQFTVHAGGEVMANNQFHTQNASVFNLEADGYVRVRNNTYMNGNNGTNTISGLFETNFFEMRGTRVVDVVGTAAKPAMLNFGIDINGNGSNNDSNMQNAGTIRVGEFGTFMGGLNGNKRFRIWDGDLIVEPGGTVLMQRFEAYRNADIVINGDFTSTENAYLGGEAPRISGEGQFTANNMYFRAGTTLAPGNNGTGTLNVTINGGEFKFEGGGVIYGLEVGSPTDHDKVAIAGKLNFDSTWKVNLSQPAGAVGGIVPTDQMDIFTFTSIQDGLQAYTIDTSAVDNNLLWDTSGATLGVDGDSVFITGLIMDLVNFNDTYTWDGGGIADTVWATATNWDLAGDPATPPTIADKAIVAAGTAAVNSAQDIHTLEISGTGAVDVQSNTLNVTNDLAISDTGSLTIAAGATLDGVNGLVMSGAGTSMDVTGTVNAKIVALDGTVALNNGAILNAQSVNINGGTTTVDNGVTVNGDFSLNAGGTLAITGDVALANLVFNNGAFNFGGAGNTLTVGAYTQTSGTSALAAGDNLVAESYEIKGGNIGFAMGDATGASTVLIDGNVTLDTGFTHTYTGMTEVKTGTLTQAAGAVINGTDHIQVKGVMNINDAVTTSGTGIGLASTQTGQLSQSIFFTSGGDASMDASGVPFQASDSRTFTGAKPDTILALPDSHSGLATSEIQNWNTFPTFNGGADNFNTVFSGTFIPSSTGTYGFRQANDDREMMYLDFNHDGIFQVSEQLGANFGDQGNKTITLTAGEEYDILAVGRENGGGQNFNWWVTKPGGPEDRVNPADPTGNGGLWATKKSYDGATGVLGTLNINAGGSLDTANVYVSGTLNIAGALNTGDIIVDGGVMSLQNATALATAGPVVVTEGGLVDIQTAQTTSPQMLIQTFATLQGDLTGLAYDNTPGAGLVSFEDNAIVDPANGANNPSLADVGGTSKLLYPIKAVGQSVKVGEIVESFGDTGFKGAYFGPDYPSGGTYGGTLTSGAGDLYILQNRDVRYNGSGILDTATGNVQIDVMSAVGTWVQANSFFNVAGTADRVDIDYDPGLALNDNERIYFEGAGAVPFGKTVAISGARARTNNNDNFQGTVIVGDGASLFLHNNVNNGAGTQIIVNDGGNLWISDDDRLQAIDAAKVTFNGESTLVLQANNQAWNTGENDALIMLKADLQIVDNWAYQGTQGLMIGDGHYLKGGHNSGESRVHGASTFFRAEPGAAWVGLAAFNRRWMNIDEPFDAQGADVRIGSETEMWTNQDHDTHTRLTQVPDGIVRFRQAVSNVGTMFVKSGELYIDNAHLNGTDIVIQGGRDDNNNMTGGVQLRGTNWRMDLSTITTEADGYVAIENWNASTQIGSLFINNANGLRFQGGEEARIVTRLGGAGSVKTGQDGHIRMLAGSTIAPGDTSAVAAAVGTLSVDDLYSDAGFNYELEVGPLDTDSVSIADRLELANAWTLELFGSGGFMDPATEYDLFSYGGSYAGTAGDITGEVTIDKTDVPTWDITGATVMQTAGRVYVTGIDGLQYRYWKDQDGDWGDVTTPPSVNWADGATADASVPDVAAGTLATIDRVGRTVTVATAAQSAYKVNVDNGSLVVGGTGELAVTSSVNIGTGAALDVQLGGVLDASAVNSTGAVTWGGSGTIGSLNATGGTVNITSQLNATNVMISAPTLNASAGIAASSKLTIDGSTVNVTGIADFATGTGSTSVKNLPDVNISAAGHLTIQAAGGAMPEGLQAHYDAGVGVSLDGGGKVTAWADQSGNGRDGTAPAAGKATVDVADLNGLDVVNFGDNAHGNNSYLNVAGDFEAEVVYTVFRNDATTWQNYGAVFGRRAGRNANWLFDNGQAGRFHGNQLPESVNRDGIELSANQFDLSATGNPINEYMVLRVDYNENTPNTNTYYINRNDHSASDLMIAEIIVFDHTLTSDEENDVGGYLASKYDIPTTFTGGLGTAFGDLVMDAGAQLTLVDSDDVAGAGSAIFESISGVGTIDGAVTVVTATTPGASAGTIVVNGDLVVGGDSTTTWEAGDLIDVNAATIFAGNVTLEDGMTLDIDEAAEPVAGTPYTLIDFEGALTIGETAAGSFGLLTNGTVNDVGAGDWSGANVWYNDDSVFVVASGLRTWDGTVGDWSSASWLPAAPSGPTSLGNMVVDAGTVTVDADHLGMDGALSLSVGGGTVNVANALSIVDATAVTSGAVNVDATLSTDSLAVSGGVVAVNTGGVLSAGMTDVSGAGALSITGTGALNTTTVNVSGGSATFGGASTIDVLNVTGGTANISSTATTFGQINIATGGAGVATAAMASTGDTSIGGTFNTDSDVTAGGELILDGAGDDIITVTGTSVFTGAGSETSINNNPNLDISATGDLTIMGSTTLGLTTGQLNQSIFEGVTQNNDSNMNMIGAAYEHVVGRTFVGTKAGTILSWPAGDTHSGLATSEISAWNTFPGFDGNIERFITAFSGAFIPDTTGDYGFRQANDDWEWMFIDMNNNGVFDDGEQMGNWNDQANHTKSLVAGEVYSFIAMAGEWGGGQSNNWWITKPGGPEDRVDPSDVVGNGGTWGTIAPHEGGSFGELNMAAGSALTLNGTGTSKFESITAAGTINGDISVSGVFAAGAGMAVNGNVTIDGSFTPTGASAITGDVLVNGTLTLADGVGDTTVTGALALASGANVDWVTTNAVAMDSVAVSGELDLSSPWTLTLQLDGAVAGGAYELFTYGSLNAPLNLGEVTSATIIPPAASPYAELIDVGASTVIDDGVDTVSLNLIGIDVATWADNAGAGGEVWATGGNWIGTTPSALVGVVVDSTVNNVATLASTSAADTLIIDGASVLIDAAGNLTVGRNSHVMDGSTLTVAASGALTSTGDTTVYTGGTLDVQGTMTLADDKNLTTSGTTTIGGTLDLAVAAGGGGMMNVIDGETTLSSGASVTLNAINAIGGILNADADLNTTGTLLQIDGGTVNSTALNAANVNVTSGSLTSVGAAIAADLNVSGGVVNTGAATLNSLSISGGDTTLAGAAITGGLSIGGGGLNTSASLTSGTASLYGGTITKTGAGAATLSTTGGVGSLQVSGGNLAVAEGSLTVNLTAPDTTLPASRNILFLIDGADGSVLTPDETAIVAQMAARGYDENDADADGLELTFLQQLQQPPADFEQKFDVVIATEELGISAQAEANLTAWYKNTSVPFVHSERAVWWSQGLTTTDAWTDVQNVTDIVVEEPTHPIMVEAGYGAVAPGTSVTIYDPTKPGPMQYVNTPDVALGDDALVIATAAEFEVDGVTPTGVAGKPTLFVYEQGSRLADNTEIALAKQINYFFDEMAHNILDPVTDPKPWDLYFATLNYAMTPSATDLPVFGTATVEAGATLTLSGAGNTAIFQALETTGVGTGTIDANIIVTDAVNPGVGVEGTLNIVNDLNVAGTATYTWDTPTDLVDVDGALTVGDGMTLALAEAGAAPETGVALPLFSYGSLNATLDSAILTEVNIDASAVPGWGSVDDMFVVDDGVDEVYLYIAPTLLWNGTSENWGDAKWTKTGVPDSPWASLGHMSVQANTVNVAAAYTGNNSALSLTVDGATANVNVTAAGNLNVIRDVDVTNGGTLGVALGGTLSANKVNSSGTTNVSGTLNAPSGLDVSGGTTTIDGGSTLNVPAVNVSGGAVLATSGIATGVDSISVDSSELAVSGDVTLTETLSLRGAMINATGTSSITASALGVAGNPNISVDGDFVLTAGEINAVKPNQLNFTFNDTNPDDALDFDNGIDGDGLDGGILGGTPPATPHASWPAYFQAIAGPDGIATGPIDVAGNPSDSYSVAWEGVFIPPTTKTYEFYVSGDDYEALWIDVDQDGEFDEATDIISDNRVPEGWNTPHTETTPVLTAGTPYRFALGFVEGGGGDFLDFTIDGVIPNPSDPAQAGWWGTQAVGGKPTFGTVALADNATMTMSLPTDSITVTNLTMGDDTTMTMDMPATVIEVTNLTIGGGSMLRSTHAATVADVEMAVSGKLTIDGSGISYLGDTDEHPDSIVDGDDNSTNLTLGDGAVIDWIFAGTGAANDGYLKVKGLTTQVGSLTVNILDGGGTAGGDDVTVLYSLNGVAPLPGPPTVTLGTLPIDWTATSIDWVQTGPSLWQLVLSDLVSGVILQDPGDTNGDRIIDATDLANFQLAFGLGGAELIAEGFAFDPDFDDDGDADLDDFVTLRQFFGTDFNPAPSIPDLSQTPEPATMSLLALGALAILRRRRRK